MKEMEITSPDILDIDENIQEKIQFDIFGSNALTEKLNNALKDATYFRIEKLPLKNRFEFEICNLEKCEVTFVAFNKNKLN